MSLNSHWFQNGQPSKLEEQKKTIRLSTKTDVSFNRSTLTAGHFVTSGSSETYS